MNKIFTCRRSSLGLIAMTMLFVISFFAIYKGHAEVAVACALPLAGIPAAIGAANAYEKKGNSNVAST